MKDIKNWQNKVNSFNLPYKKYQALEIIWIDAMGGDDGWETEEDYEPHPDSQGFAKTIGYYWGNTPQTIIVLQSYFIEKENRQIDRPLQIPKVCLIKITELSSSVF